MIGVPLCAGLQVVLPPVAGGTPVAIGGPRRSVDLFCCTAASGPCGMLRVLSYASMQEAGSLLLNKICGVLPRSCTLTF
jgi:hypothetical protein